MKTDLKLHHCAQRIAPGSLDFVLDLFAELDFELLERSTVNEIAWIAQRGNPFVLQFVESEQRPLPTETKYNTHIAFISERPKEEVGRLKEWIQARGIKTSEGSWTEREFWLDCPEVFVDFVLEIMHRNIVED